MDPERLQEIENLFHAALERKSDERSAFLKEICADDEELYQEVESLLGYAEEENEHVIEPPPVDVIAKLMIDDFPHLTQRRSLGPYRICEKVGEGGMGEVYRAIFEELSLEVSLKVLPLHLTKYKERVRQLEREALIMASLEMHMEVPRAYRKEEIEDVHFIVLDYVLGETLRQYISNRQMRLGQILNIVKQVAIGLTAIHQTGIVHCDIKPENIMLRCDGRIAILDFGIAKMNEARPRSRHILGSEIERETPLVGGTLKYMSPEQVQGLDVDRRTDIWSLGVVFYEMLMRHVPFGGEMINDVLASILEDEPLPLSQYSPQLPSKLQPIVSKALRKDREERYQTAQELVYDLISFSRELEIKLEYFGTLPEEQSLWLI